MHNHSYTQRKQTYIYSSIQNVHHHSLNDKYKCRDEMVKNTYLMKNSSRNQLRRCNVSPNHRPACSSISQQRCHARAGHDSSGLRVNCRLTHSQGTHQTAKPTPLGLSSHPQIGQASTVRRPTTAHRNKQSLHSPVKKQTTGNDTQTKGET